MPSQVHAPSALHTHTHTHVYLIAGADWVGHRGGLDVLEKRKNSRECPRMCTVLSSVYTSPYTDYIQH
jgi:hypothetical protein